MNVGVDHSRKDVQSSRIDFLISATFDIWGDIDHLSIGHGDVRDGRLGTSDDHAATHDQVVAAHEAALLIWSRINLLRTSIAIWTSDSATRSSG